MRPISELVPDVTIAAPGAPPFVVMHALTRSLAKFLSEAEAWREWSYDVDPADVVAANGLFEWEKYVDPTDVDYTDYLWLRTKRVDLIHWGDESCALAFKTARQLSRLDSEWRTREEATPTFFTNEGSGGGGVRFVAIPNGTSYGALMVRARLVVITNVVSGMGTDALDAQIPELPDRLFERYRDVIVAGALSILYAIPGRDWTSLGQVDYQKGEFDKGVHLAKAEAAADYGHPVNVVAYNDY